MPVIRNGTVRDMSSIIKRKFFEFNSAKKGRGKPGLALVPSADSPHRLPFLAGRQPCECRQEELVISASSVFFA